jgi:hypothetical protein
MVLCRVDCGLPLFHGFLTQMARSWCGSLCICILASLPIQQRDLLVRKMRISGMLDLMTLVMSVNETEVTWVICNHKRDHESIQGKK